MLDFIRQNVGSWMVKFILGAIVVVFVFWGIGSFRSSRMDVAAKVNGEKILFETFREAYSRVLENYQRMFGGTIPEFIKKDAIKKQVLNELINKALINQAAAKMGIIVSDEEIRQTIVQLRAFQSNGGFSQDLYERLLKQNRLTPAKFETSVREELTLEKVKAILAAGIDVPDSEAEDRYRYENQQISLQYLTIDPDDCEQDVKYSEKDLKTWYAAHEDSYKTEPLRKIRYLVFKKADEMKHVIVPADKISAYYKEHMDEFSVKEQRKARHILLRLPQDASEEDAKKVKAKADRLFERLRKGESFVKLASKYSEDPGSAKNGGDLGFFSKGTMITPFDDKVFSMKEGEISPPIRTKFGWHIIKLEKIKPQRLKPLKDVRPIIEAKLKSQEAGKVLWEKANKAYDEIIELGGLDAYAKKHGLKLNKSEFFSQSNPPRALGFSLDVITTLFSLSQGELSSLLEIPQGVLIAQILEIKPSRIPDLKEIEAWVKKDYIKEKARELCTSRAKEILKEARKKGIMPVAKARKLELKETGFFRRGDRTAGGKLPAQVAEAAASLYKTKPYPEDVIQANGKFFILAFKQAKAAEMKGFDKAKDILKKRILAQKQQGVFEDWLNHLRTKATIEINRNI